MSENRAKKSGFAAEAQKKINDKYEPDMAEQCLVYIRDLVNSTGEDSVDFPTSGDQTNFGEVLHNGVYLARAVNVLMPGCIKKKAYEKPPTMAFKQMELIGQFVENIGKYGVPDHERFQTVDLYESQNLAQVVTCIQTLARKAQSKGQMGFGPKEADANKREFTEEQLKAGQNVIGLQMGSNKGATQAGQNFGKGRFIVD